MQSPGPPAQVQEHGGVREGGQLGCAEIKEGREQGGQQKDDKEKKLACAECENILKTMFWKH